MQGGVPVARLPLCCLLLMFLPALWNAAGTEVESCLHVNTTLCVENCCALTNYTTLLCCHLDSDFHLKEAVAQIAPKNANIRSLYVYNASYDTVDVSITKIFNFDVLSITGGKLKRISGELHNTTVCLNFSGNSISEIDDNTFASLNQVKILDLSRNNLSSLPKSLMSIRNLTLDISGNFKLWCTDVKSLLAPNRSDPVDFRNPNDTYCLANKTFHWFNSTDKYSLKALEESIKAEQTCPPVCKCDAARTMFIGREPSFSVMADCSNSNLTSLPPNLPQNTYYLNVSNNNITSLAALSTDPTYEGIRELDADNNFITSISELEGTKFISNFHVLSLQNNRIASVPTYFLTDTFSRNRNMLSINLAGNKLSCECNTAQALKKWFLSNKGHIKDTDKVMCANLPISVVNLEISEICAANRVLTDYIYYIIAGEVLLLALLISKVSYDYWVFRTVGHLPWPASKMPKLPCDWLCEA
ncbi:protein halfway [Schistocerca americana]|uniref:protein halfway n=1 Tax=Schistocerca americana TaxID=7009 RepID=UPI001F501A24|nr:protein halfway [Schistocerca americana]XP_047105398.1 protein halfway [Schistocerca piceifrons]